MPYLSVKAYLILNHKSQLVSHLIFLHRLSMTHVICAWCSIIIICIGTHGPSLKFILTQFISGFENIFCQTQDVSCQQGYIDCRTLLCSFQRIVGKVVSILCLFLLRLTFFHLLFIVKLIENPVHVLLPRNSHIVCQTYA